MFHAAFHHIHECMKSCCLGFQKLSLGKEFIAFKNLFHVAFYHPFLRTVFFLLWVDMKSDLSDCSRGKGVHIVGKGLPELCHSGGSVLNGLAHITGTYPRHSPAMPLPYPPSSLLIILHSCIKCTQCTEQFLLLGLWGCCIHEQIEPPPPPELKFLHINAVIPLGWCIHQQIELSPPPPPPN